MGLRTLPGPSVRSVLRERVSIFPWHATPRILVRKTWILPASIRHHVTARRKLRAKLIPHPAHRAPFTGGTDKMGLGES